MVNIYCYSWCDNHLIFTDLIKCRCRYDVKYENWVRVLLSSDDSSPTFPLLTRLLDSSYSVASLPIF